MFASTNYGSSNPFPTLPSSSYSPLPYFVDPENVFASDTFLHDPLCGPFIPTHNAPIPETVTNLAVADCTAMVEQDANGIGAHCGSSIPNFLTKKPAISKKDRHSKIHTSQGFRDRRVRLSSKIARKFFDLQDMLQFDKPSNTLEWLFTKSENAIQELARSKHSCSGGGKCSCDPSELHGIDSNEKSLVGGDASKERNLKCEQKENVCVQTKKESREKARARARERASYKMCSTGRVQDLKERCPANANAQILHQLRSSIQTEACARWPNLVQPHPHLVGGEALTDGLNFVEESIVIKRNLKPSLMSSHHQNLAIPKEASFNNNDYHSFPYSTPNWDTNGAINGRSNFCGMATMNLSTELQIFGKSWEECTNQIVDTNLLVFGNI